MDTNLNIIPGLIYILSNLNKKDWYIRTSFQISEEVQYHFKTLRVQFL